MATASVSVILNHLVLTASHSIPQVFAPALFAFPAFRANAQETVFDVPSADILDQGKVYGELDGTIHLANQSFATFTPRVVVGGGSGIEGGANFDGLSASTLDQLDVALTVKWRLWQAKTSGWSFSSLATIC